MKGEGEDVMERSKVRGTEEGELVDTQDREGGKGKGREGRNRRTVGADKEKERGIGEVDG